MHCPDNTMSCMAEVLGREHTHPSRFPTTTFDFPKVNDISCLVLSASFVYSKEKDTDNPSPDKLKRPSSCGCNIYKLPGMLFILHATEVVSMEAHESAKVKVMT